MKKSKTSGALDSKSENLSTLRQKKPWAPRNLKFSTSALPPLLVCHGRRLRTIPPRWPPWAEAPCPTHSLLAKPGGGWHQRVKPPACLGAPTDIDAGPIHLQCLAQQELTNFVCTFCESFCVRDRTSINCQSEMRGFNCCHMVRLQQEDPERSGDQGIEGITSCLAAWVDLPLPP